VDDLAWMDATEQARLVRDGEASVPELVEAAIERIERVNPSLNAVITPMYELARPAALVAPTGGPIAGVPFLLKDLGASFAGVRQTAGSRFLIDHVAHQDSEHTARLKRAGLIVVGKTNTPEFGILGTTEPDLFGSTRNPWDPSRSVGGSSGGSAAAVAAGLVPMAHANDGGGSIRIPASCCGVFGLKPTRARNTLAPSLGDAISGLVAEHAVTRSVRDSAALLDATAGPAVGDPYWAPPPDGPFVDEVGREPGRLRIAFSSASPFGSSVHADCVRAVQDAAELCVLVGHDVEEAAPDVDAERLAAVFDVLWTVGIAAELAAWERSVGHSASADQVEVLTWAMCRAGLERTGVEYLLAVEDMHRIARSVARFHLTYDVWLTPTVSMPPPQLGWISSTVEEPLRAYVRDTEFCPFTPVQNLTGQPAMSVPLWWSDEGLPVGVHFAGRFGDEATLFRLAGQLEQARPWRDRRPPISA
jgi:amidase